MKLDKEKLRQIALIDLQHKHHDSVYDCWTEALEKYLNQEGLKIVTVKEWAAIEAKRHQELSKVLD